MKPSVILYKNLPDELRTRLEHHCNITEINGLTPENIRQHQQAFCLAEGLLGSGARIDETLLEKMPQLRACSTISVGYDNFDLPALNRRNILLMHTPLVLTETVADTIMALVLASARRITELDAWLKAGHWRHSIGPDKYGTDVHHKTIGILGMGRIGMALAQRAHMGFSMPVLYHARKPHPAAETRFNARHCDLQTLLEESDFLCITLPLTEQTHHLIGAEQLQMMKPGAILVNAGRGPVVDEQAFTAALKNGTLLAAGLDVFEQEPIPANAELLRLTNVVTLPHIGSATHETRYAMTREAVDNLIAALNGQPDKNCVNPF